jgi:DNA repair protein RadC
MVRSALDVYELMLPHIMGRQKETFWVLSLNVRHRLRRVHRVAEGSLAQVAVHPREVFRPLLRHGAAAAILVHNHPSGDPEPSQDDLALTRRLREVGHLTGIPVLDHIIVAQGCYVSLADQGLV